MNYCVRILLCFLHSRGVIWGKQGKATGTSVELICSRAVELTTGVFTEILANIVLMAIWSEKVLGLPSPSHPQRNVCQKLMLGQYLRNGVKLFNESTQNGLKI